MVQLKLREEHILVLIIILQIAIGIYGMRTLEDLPIHLEIARAIGRHPLNPTNYEPLAPVTLTYPPLLHYFSLFLSLSGISLELSLRLAGVLLFALFPFAMYLLGGCFSKRVGILAAAFSIVTINYAYVYILGELPQCLGMDLFVLFLWAALKKRQIIAGVFLGLSLLSHPFLGPFTLLFAFLILAIRRTWNSAVQIFIGLFIVLPWVHKYILIVQNALSNSWNNTFNYTLYPGWITLAIAGDYFIRLNPLLILLAFAGFVLLFKEKKLKEEKLILIILFALTFFFTIYHYTPFQLKMLDILTIPTVLCGAYFVDKLYRFFPYKYLVTTIVCVFVLVSIIGPLERCYVYSHPPFELPEGYREAAVFLQHYDKNKSFIVVYDEPRVLFKTELVIAEISNKTPMDAIISDLERYGPEYQQRLADRKKIIQGNESLLRIWNVKYVFSKNCTQTEIFRNDHVAICKVQ
jgi:hypothetical protein